MASDFAIFEVEGNERKINTVFDMAEVGDWEGLSRLARKTRHFEVDAKDRYGRTILMWASDKGHLDAVEACLRLGASIEVTEPLTGRTAMHWASRGGFADIIQVLIDEGADIHAPDKYGMNPLYLALQVPPG